MSIDSLRSGAIRICFDPSLNVFPNRCRLLIEGQKLPEGINPKTGKTEGIAEDGQLLKIPSLRDVDELFGEGSVIAEGLRTAFGCCLTQAMDIYALPRADAS